MDHVAAETWFLRHGLPSVLSPSARWRRLWSRSAPALAGLAVIQVVAMAVAIASGRRGVYIGSEPSAKEWAVLALLAAAVPLAVVVGWRVSRLGAASTRRVASAAAVAVIVVAGALTVPLGAMLGNVWESVVLVAVVLVCTGLGIGSVLGWAFRLTGSHLASVGTLVARALPVVLLTVLVFFNGAVWNMATRLSRDRIWLIVLFLSVIAVAFLLTGLFERVRPVLGSTAPIGDDDASHEEALAATPFADIPDPPEREPVSRGERVNVMFVVVASQLTQVVMVALVTSVIFGVLGLLVLSPPLLADWTKNGATQGVVAGMTLPIPQQLIHVIMFLGALTFMYVSARAVGDGEYRSQFLDPIIEDLRVVLVARERYRAAFSAR